MIRVLLVLVLFAPLFSYGATVNNLYDVRLPVDSKASEDLKVAASQGLSIVLTRITGRSDADSVPEVASALANASRLLVKYAYSETEENQSVIDLNFSRSQVDAVVKRAGLPLWGNDRPAVLAWVVVDESSRRRFITEETWPQLMRQIEAEAERRGLPIRFPIGDSEDTAVLSPDEAWRLNREALQLASERYRADALLVGRVKPQSGRRLGSSWVLMIDNEERSIDVPPQSDRFFAQAIDDVADALANKYAVAAHQEMSEKTYMHVAGLNAFNDYGGLVSYLERLTGVEHANMVWIEGSNIVLELTLKGDSATVQKSFALNRKLSEDLDAQSRYLSGAGGTSMGDVARGVDGFSSSRASAVRDPAVRDPAVRDPFNAVVEGPDTQQPYPGYQSQSPSYERDDGVEYDAFGNPIVSEEASRSAIGAGKGPGGFAVQWFYVWNGS